MQALDLPDSSAMPENSSPIHSSKDIENNKGHVESDTNEENSIKKSSVPKSSDTNSVVVRRERPSRACTQRAAAKMQAAAEAEAAMAEAERKRKKARKTERLAARLLREESEEEEEEERFGVGDEGMEEEEEDNGEDDCSPSSSKLQCGKIVTPLVGELEPSQLPRWNIRSMWELASILNFLNVFRPLLNIKVEFSAEEFETALITPNNTLGDVHMPLLKAIPPVTRMALGHGTWVTVLCRKLRDWWHWVAEGDLPIVASHGAEVEAYKALDPGVRVLILKAICDIRVEQEDIRSYIDGSIKNGVHLSAFRKERVGGDSHGISYWYEDDQIIGHRLYREIRKFEVKKGRGKNVPPMPHSSYQWEAVATNLDEFQNVSEKLFSSKNRTEISVGKKLKNDMLPEIEIIHKRKEKLLKKQHRQALMLDGMMSTDLAAGRSLRDRKPVTYTFDDYDRSINEALKVTKKKQQSPEHFEGRDLPLKREISTNGTWSGPSQYPRQDSFSALSPASTENDEFYDEQQTETLDRGNRRRQKPQRYSMKEFVEAASDNDADFDSDDDIVGEVVYDDEYLKKRKQTKRASSSSEGDEEYHLDEEVHEDEEEEEEEDDSSQSTSDESDNSRQFKPVRGRTRRATKSRAVDDFQSGLRRSKRATRNHIDYRQLEMSESENESMKGDKLNNAAALDEEYSDASDNADLSRDSQNSEENMDMDKQEIHSDQAPEILETKQIDPPEQSNSGDKEIGGVKKRRFLDLNELAPGSGIDDCPSSMKDEDADDF